MLQKQEFTYNNIPDQNIRYANQLTVKAWNDYINILKDQANYLTTYVQTLHTWLFGQNGPDKEDDNTDIIYPEKYNSFTDYVLKTLLTHIQTLKDYGKDLTSHSTTLSNHEDRLDSLEKDNSSNISTLNNHSNRLSTLESDTRFLKNETSNINTNVHNIVNGPTEVNIAKNYSTVSGNIKTKFDDHDTKLSNLTSESSTHTTKLSNLEKISGEHSTKIDALEKGSKGFSGVYIITY